MTENYLIFTDLDGTIIRSAKNRSETDVVVEWKNGEAITCVSEFALGKFAGLKNVVPVTTRSIEQYLRIEIPNFKPKYAICSNGGNLLIDGEICGEWHKFSENEFEKCRSEMENCRKIFENDINRSFEIRLVDGLFLFTKSRCVSETLKNANGFENLNCFSVGEKVYAFPKVLNKGDAVKRFIERENFHGKIICAGDSLPDIPMLNIADTAIFPTELSGVTAKEKLCAPRENFCDFTAEMFSCQQGF